MIANRVLRTVSRRGAKQMGVYKPKASLPMDGAFQAKSRYGRSMEVVSYAMGAVITCWSYVQLQNALEIDRTSNK